jgi:hypothetical protein
VELMTIQTEERRRTSLRQLLDPIADALTSEAAQALVDLRADPTTQARLDDLAERNQEGQLSVEEFEEYKSLVNASDLIAVLQAKARAALLRRQS